MKYARDAVETMSAEAQDDHLQMQHDLYDDDSEDFYQGFERPDSASDETGAWQTTDDSYEDGSPVDEEGYSEDASYPYEEDAPYQNEDGEYEDVPEEAEELPETEDAYYAEPAEEAEEQAEAEDGDAHGGRRRSRRHQE